LGNSAVSNATCFLNMLDVCKENTGHKRMLLQDGKTRWGWRNRLSGPGTATYRLWAGAGQCLTSNGADVGGISVGCQNTGANGNAVVQLSLLQTLGTGIDNHYYLGCAEITKCNPSNFAAAGAPTIRVSGAEAAASPGPFNCYAVLKGGVVPPGGSCGGSINFNNVQLAGSAPKAFNMNCKCDAVRWVFHQGGGTHYPEPLGDGTCPRDP
jgi:hypothetical protein